MSTQTLKHSHQLEHSSLLSSLNHEVVKLAVQSQQCYTGKKTHSSHGLWSGPALVRWAQTDLFYCC